MKPEKMTYSYAALDECQKKIDGLRSTVQIKAQHPWMCYEVCRAYDFCYDQTGCCLFLSDWSYSCGEYRKMVNGTATKKEMDACLKRCVRDLQNLVSEIRSDMASGAIGAIV